MDGGHHDFDGWVFGRKHLPPKTQALLMGVIVLGVTASAYTLGALIQYLLEGEFDRILGEAKNEP